MNIKIKCIFIGSIFILSSILILPAINADVKKSNSFQNEFDIIEMIGNINKSMILEYHEGLMAFGARYTGSENISLAAEYLYDCFENIGLEVNYHNWNFGGFQGKNVVATLTGNKPESQGIYVMSAHYDCSEGSMGANDDGSGVAGMLAIAEIISKYSFNHTIRFIAFSGEEVGTYGSFVYARDSYNNGDNIIAVLNVDMIAYAVTSEGSNLISFMHPERATWIAEYADLVSNEFYEYFNLSVESKPNHRGADHQAFVDFGYDGVWIVHHDIFPWCNTPMDTPEKMNWTYQVKATKFLLALTAKILNRQIDVQAILISPNESYLYIFGRPLFQINFLKNWNSGIRGITILLGRADAKVNIITDEEISHVIFCIDNEFLFWDSDPPFEWNIIGWYWATSVGRHNLRVFAYTKSGSVGYDEMDLFMLSSPKYKGKWPPSQPCDPNPANGAIDVPIDIDLTWNGGDYDPGDAVTYDIYFGTDPDPQFLEQIGPFGWSDVTINYDLPDLDQGTQYYWKIIAKDRQGASAKSPMWSFTTV